ncbi:MAG: peptidylprolyl isomerase [Candidatus Lernaella stagnicola]|nr:peptidylprolyl isomerase [Candidatus Lernaella stagnicola]
MALSILRRSKQSLLVKILLGAVALSFIIGFGAMSYVGRTAGRGGQNKQAWVAQVDGVPIGARVLVNTEQSIAKMYRDRFGESADSFLANMDMTGIALNKLITERVIQSLALQMGLTVTDAELGNTIVKNPVFYQNGRFNRERYIQILRRQKVSPTDYETDLRRQLLGQKLRSLVLSSVKVAESEVQEEFDNRELKVNLRFVKLEPDKVKGEVKVTDESANAFFEKDKERFKMPEKRKAEYAVFDASSYVEDVVISEAQITQYYEANRDREFKQPEQAHARHILINVDADADTALKEAARIKAEDILDQLKDGGDFAELAKKYSEDPGTKDKGGDLGFFGRGRMVKVFEETAFSLEPGKRSGVVESPYGFHIIETLEKRAESILALEDVKARIERRVKTLEARRMAKADADAAKAELTPGADILRFGNDRGLKVVSTSTFTKDEGVPGIRNGRRAAIDLFQLQTGDISEPFVTGDQIFLFKLTNIVESHIPEFADVAEKVREELRKELEQQALQTKGEQIIAALNAGQKFDAVATARGLDIQETGLFARQQTAVPKVGAAPELQVAAFALTSGSPVVEKPYQAGSGVVVAVLKERVEPSPAAYRVKRDELRDELVGEKADLTLQAWIEQAQKSIPVERNEEVIRALSERSKSRRAGGQNG